MSIHVGQIYVPKKSSENYYAAKGQDLCPTANRVLTTLDPRKAAYVVFARMVLGAIRFAMKEYRCNMIPVIKEMRVIPRNEWSDTFVIVLQYDKSGYYTMLAGHFLEDDATKIKWSVYMD